MELLHINYKKLMKYEEKWCDYMGYFNPYVDPFEHKLTNKIPYFDKIAYNKYPINSWVYDKLLIAKTQKLKCGTLEDIVNGTMEYPIFIKPRWGHKSASSKNCFKIHSDEQLKKYKKNDEMIWSEFIDDTEGMTDFFLLNGTIKHQITYKYSDTQHGFSEEWKYIGPENKPPEHIVEWVDNNMCNFTGIVNVQYRGNKIIEVGLRLARGGAYILSTENEHLIRNINNIMVHSKWDHTCKDEMNFKPFYSFKCFTTTPIIYIFPQHMIDKIMKSHGAKPFYEYYFEPVGNEGQVFFQFLHDDYDQGHKLKVFMERLFDLFQYMFIILFVLSIILMFFKFKYGVTMFCIVFILMLTRYLNPITANYQLYKAKQSVWVK